MNVPPTISPRRIPLHFMVLASWLILLVTIMPSYTSHHCIENVDRVDLRWISYKCHIVEMQQCMTAALAEAVSSPRRHFTKGSSWRRAASFTASRRRRSSAGLLLEADSSGEWSERQTAWKVIWKKTLMDPLRKKYRCLLEKDVRTYNYKSDRERKNWHVKTKVYPERG